MVAVLATTAATGTTWRLLSALGNSNLLFVTENVGKEIKPVGAANNHDVVRWQES